MEAQIIGRRTERYSRSSGTFGFRPDTKVASGRRSRKREVRNRVDVKRSMQLTTGGAGSVTLQVVLDVTHVDASGLGGSRGLIQGEEATMQIESGVASGTKRHFLI